MIPYSANSAYVIPPTWCNSNTLCDGHNFFNGCTHQSIKSLPFTNFLSPKMERFYRVSQVTLITFTTI
ncbi:4825_t:CDS:1, partial [Funneliformis mosseae]